MRRVQCTAIDLQRDDAVQVAHGNKRREPP